MKGSALAVWFCCALSCAPKAPSSPAKERVVYRIAPRDELRIVVLGSPEFTGSQRVSIDGKLSLPLLGDVGVEGLTEVELARELEKRLADGFLKEPQVTVAVATFGESVYVIGEVTRPGAYPFHPNLTVLQALALAGGATPRASTSRTRVMRPDGEGAVTIVPVDPGDPLKPDDVLVVPERVF